MLESDLERVFLEGSSGRTFGGGEIYAEPQMKRQGKLRSGGGWSQRKHPRVDMDWQCSKHSQVARGVQKPDPGKEWCGPWWWPGRRQMSTLVARGKASGLLREPWKVTGGLWSHRVAWHPLLCRKIPSATESSPDWGWARAEVGREVGKVLPDTSERWPWLWTGWTWGQVAAMGGIGDMFWSSSSEMQWWWGWAKRGRSKHDASVLDLDSWMERGLAREIEQVWRVWGIESSVLNMWSLRYLFTPTPSLLYSLTRSMLPRMFLLFPRPSIFPCMIKISQSLCFLDVLSVAEKVDL